MTASDPAPSIAILLATCNGARHLHAQLDSLAAQHLRPRLIVVSDDGSTDTSREIVAAFAAAHPELDLRLIDGPQRGSAQNFLHLLRQVPDSIDMVAFADQDDVWMPDRLQRGARALRDTAPDQPAIACGRSLVCDAKLEGRRLSALPQRQPGFRHALVQNIAGGNTMLLNRAATHLLRDASLEARKVIAHDWWAYQIVAGAGGAVLFDTEPLLLYRQHGENQIGANHGLGAQSRRFVQLVRRRYQYWNSINIVALRASAHRFTPENRALLADFAAMRGAGLGRRLRLMRRLGLYRQGPPGRISLWLAAVLGRL
jgi:glycosyltransferase involved in cell wall biosynthesis